MVCECDVTAAAAEAEAAAAALDVRGRAPSVDEEDHLLLALQAPSYCGVEPAAEDAAVAFAELSAHVDDLDVGEVALFV
jgi:hypothetical protein